MRKEELLALAERFAGTVADCPFKDDFETTVFRHKDTRKWFGVWLYVPFRHFAAFCAEKQPRQVGAWGGGAESGSANRGGEFCLNVKCPPDLAPVLVQQEKGVYPAYHMNRRHWITLRLGECDGETAEQLFRLSYALTLRGAAARKRGGAQ